MTASQPDRSAARAWSRATVAVSAPTLTNTLPRPAVRSTSRSVSRARSSDESRVTSETIPVPSPSAPTEKIQSISRFRSATSIRSCASKGTWTIGSTPARSRLAGRASGVCVAVIRFPCQWPYQSPMLPSL